MTVVTKLLVNNNVVVGRVAISGEYSPPNGQRLIPDVAGNVIGRRVIGDDIAPKGREYTAQIVAKSGKVLNTIVVESGFEPKMSGNNKLKEIP